MEDQYDDTHTNGAAAAKHTQFLDLTNGEGGERSNDEEDPMSSPSARSPGVSPSNGGGRGTGRAKFDPNTPGRVVETGQEATGRWTKEEHEAFLSALQTYGKEWKKVAAKVKTRTVVQTRTHAQKYFQKLAKVVESGKEHVAQVEMGAAASEARRAAATQKKKQRLNSSATKGQQQTSVASAAHLISNLSSGAESSAPAVDPYHVSGATLPSNAFSNQKPTAATTVQGVGLVKPPLLANHGFSNYNITNAVVSANGASFMASKPVAKTFPMKITAPEHDAAMKRGRFPEPSPAACGKRKLAEIAAARMLAGVAAVGDKPLLDSLMEDGTVTPPPEEDTKMQISQIPVPPKFEKTEPTATRKPIGLSLQIVNPESLGVSYDQQKQRKEGQTSPVTPWEGDMKVLMRYVEISISKR
jgi:SHAQKYF class myb-like DNA-binding protein